MNTELPKIVSAPNDLEVEEFGSASRDQLTAQEAELIGARLGSIVLENSVLFDHQEEAFDNLVSFFQAGGREGYLKAPTSTGKTVLFVTLVDQFIKLSKEQGRQPRVAVLTPTTQLADQTVGGISQKGKKRGFKGFAPDLDVRAVHSNKSRKSNEIALVNAEVISLTYNTFRNLINRYIELEETDPEELREEIRVQRAKIPILKREIGLKKNDAQHYLHSAYKKQIVNFFRDDAEAYLESKDEHELKDQEVELLQAIIELIDVSAGHPETVNRLRRLLAKNVNQRIKDQLTKWQLQLDENQKRIEKTKKDGTKLDRGKPLVFIDPTKDNGPLSRLEYTMAKFIWFSRPTRRIIYSDISSHEERAKYTNLVNEADNRREALRMAKGKAEGAEKKLKILETGLQIDLLICDEAHRSIGTQTWDAIRSYAARKGIAVVGFTATDEYEDRNLEEYYGALIHELKKEEAIERKLTNPIAMFVHETGMIFDRVELDIKGDYDSLTMRSMRFNEERNNQAVDFAKQLTEAGYAGAISAIPGDEGDHAKVLAGKINKTIITDPATGEQRYMKARYILQNSKNRQLYLDQFETGEIDWLVYVDVLREGWDSDRAKALINTRSTLSPLLAEQRLGRIGRLSETGQISIVIDFYDKIIELENRYALPPVLAADVYGLDDIEQGTIIGKPDEDKIPAILKKLKKKLPNKIEAKYTKFKKAAENIPVYNNEGGNLSSREWKTLDDLHDHYRGYLPKEIILDEIQLDQPRIRFEQRRIGNRVVTVFNLHDIDQLHSDKPLLNPWKLYVDPESGTKWISPEGCTKLLMKKYPSLRASDILDAIRKLESKTGQPFTRSVGLVRVLSDETRVRNGFTNLYQLDEIIERLVPELTKK